MRPLLRFRVATGCMMTLAALWAFPGCAAPRSQKASHSDSTREKLPAPFVDSALYMGHEGARRDTVHITGAYFDLKGDTNGDVITSLDLRHWEPAKKIVNASGTSYTAVVAHSAAFDHVYVRVFGMNGQYTLPIQIEK